ncbi:MAG: cell division protein FtsQ/DivIB [Fusobacteriaceae bacterium]|nr:cell division protein FtsQ/DivIB [Fusobacteriaceae bacterium]MBP6322478.1 cell division protein FtsQ/DivIB [Fusobacteriaceae bacterium]MBP9509715.1 cell division protein FtsQ/DivIB [Fusobacteriaceae bacterium]
MLKFFLGTLYLTIFLFVIDKVEKNYISKPEFKLSIIKYNGNYSLIKDELIKLSDSIYGKSIWELPLNKLKQKIQEDIRVKSVNISYPKLGAVDFLIEEKEPSYYANINGKNFAIGEKGEIFAFIEEISVKELPIIFVNSEEEIEDILKLLFKIKDAELVKMITKIYYKSPIEIDLLIDKDVIIKTQQNVIDEKYDVLRELYFNLSKDKKIEYIDLRFDGYVVKEIGADSIDKPKRDN